MPISLEHYLEWEYMAKSHESSYDDFFCPVCGRWVRYGYDPHHHDIKETYRKGFIVDTSTGAYLTVREIIDGGRYEEHYGPFRGWFGSRRAKKYAKQMNITLVRAPLWATVKQRWRFR